MSIRQKILIYFSALSITIVGIIFLIIYTLFSNYRQEEFQQRIKDKTISTLKYLVEIKQIDHDVLQTMDKYTINNLYNEKILIFNKEKILIYSSLDDTKIDFPSLILNQLSKHNPLIEYTEKDFDVIGIYFEFNNESYFGISKALDKHGISKLNYLKSVFIIIYILYTSLVLFLSFYISKQISSSLIKMSEEIKNVNFDNNISYINVPKGNDEIVILAKRFNALLKKLSDSFAFQKHAINHISHELKTPIAILVSNFERIENEQDSFILRQFIKNQKGEIKKLADIINSLLEISKIESSETVNYTKLRIDELIFNKIEEINHIYPDFMFEVNIYPSIEHDNDLTINLNEKLIDLVITNMLSNCQKYSSDKISKINIEKINNKLHIQFINKGEFIQQKEKEYLFKHLFRGKNSISKNGFGLGLVLTDKILKLHSAEIHYNSDPINHTNIFTLIFNQA